MCTRKSYHLHLKWRQDIGLRKYKIFTCLIIIIEAATLFGCNVWYRYYSKNNSTRLYRVEARRVAQEIQEHSLEEVDIRDYDTILAVSEFSPTNLYNNDYVIEEIDGKLYCIEYRAIGTNGIMIYINIAMLLMIALTAIVLIYVGKNVIAPFQDMSHLSYELAKGNLSVPVKEQKSKLFGRFLWGMDMLREKLEDNKEKELQFQKEKKTLILSLSHDIKTPLSAIELYAKALSSGLYESQEKREEAFSGIARNVSEIKGYVDEIASASREDFLNLEVTQGEVYLLEVIHGIERYYRDKLCVIHTNLQVEQFANCLIKGDKDRLIEVLQNIMENAIKYGDGKEIKIYGEDEEDCKLIVIENTGCGLKAEELQNIFDSFYRGSNSQAVSGNGLGLFICKNLMKKMDGDIFAQIQDDRFRMTVVVRKA